MWAWVALPPRLQPQNKKRVVAASFIVEAVGHQEKYGISLKQVPDDWDRGRGVYCLFYCAVHEAGLTCGKTGFMVCESTLDMCVCCVTVKSTNEPSAK